MTSTAYVLLASACILLAIMVRLLVRHDAVWLTKNLRSGDLQALAKVAGGNHFGVGRDRLIRLTARGFACEDRWGGCRLTLKGRYAAFLMRVRGLPGRDPARRDRASA
jgi:hypothetical protein